MSQAAADLAGRLRETREFLGFAHDQVTGALGWPADVLVQLEDGTLAPSTDQLRRLGALYRRPVEWFHGESQFRPSLGLLRQVEHLHPGDREVVLDFAEWLQGAGPPPKRDGAAQ
jgi:hypothetical protein